MSSYTTELPKESDIEKITKKMESLIDSFDRLNTSIKKVSTSISGLKLNQLNTQASKVAGSISDVSKKSETLTDSFATMGTQALNAMTSVNKGVTDLKNFTGLGNTITEVANNLKNLKNVKTFGLVTAGVAGLTIGLNGANDAAYNLSKGVGNATDETVKLVGSFASAAAGGAALGSVIPGVGTAIGGIIGFTTAAISSLIGMDNAIKDVAKENLFGEVNISMEKWKQHFDESSLSVSNAADKYSALCTNIATLSETFNTNVETLDLYGVKFGMMSQKISAEDCANIQNAVNNMCASTSQMIEENTNYSLGIWGDLFSKVNVMSEEQELNMLSAIIENGNFQKAALETAQNSIIETYSNAMQTRGQLTQEEYLFIQEQMEKIREMTVDEMTASEAQLELMKAEFNSNKLAMDEESYGNYKAALIKYEEEKKAIAQDSYAAYIIDADKQYKQGIINEEAYLAAKESAYELYQQDIAAIDTYVLDSNKQIGQDLLEAWNSLTGDTSAEAIEQRRIIKEMYSDLGLDTTELEESAKKSGESIGLGFSQKMSENLKVNAKGVYREWNDMIDKLSDSASIINNSGTGISLAGIIGVLSLAKISSYASGGFVPNMGQLFIANEPGNPELIGNIGGRTAVVNNRMILDGIQSAMRNAVIEGMQLVYGRNVHGDMYVDIYIDGVFTERKLIKANERHLMKTGKPVFVKG